MRSQGGKQREKGRKEINKKKRSRRAGLFLVRTGKCVCVCVRVFQCENRRQIDHMDGRADGGQVVLRTS